MSQIRTAFFKSLPRHVSSGTVVTVTGGGNRRRPRTESDSAVILPRPPVFAEIVRGPLDPAGGARSKGAVDGEEGNLGRDKDFDFREVFVVYEDQDLVGCPPLREVSEMRHG